MLFLNSYRCADSFYAIYPVNLPTNESHKVLNQENSGQRPRLIRGHVSCLARFSNGSVNLAVDCNRLALWIIGFVAGKLISVVQWWNSRPRLSYSAEQRLFSVLLCFQYVCWKVTQNISQLRRRLFRKHLHEWPKIVTTATVKNNGSSGFIGTRSCCKNTLWKDSEKKLPTRELKNFWRRTADCKNVFRSNTECIRSGGRHFQHVL